MKIAGLIKSSVIDFPENIAAVIFTQGCNFRCGFCHNPDLLDQSKAGTYPEEEILAFLEKRKNVLDGVVITGGEPTVDPDLIEFIKKLKHLGYSVKLDTNGSNPEIVEKLIRGELVDYVAMDIKGPLEKYAEISKYVDTEKIKETVKLLLNAEIKCEFRTTVLPFYHKLEDFVAIGRLIEGAELYTVQGFRPKITFDANLQSERSFLKTELLEIEKVIRPFVKTVRVLDNS